MSTTPRTTMTAGLDHLRHVNGSPKKTAAAMTMPASEPTITTMELIRADTIEPLAVDWLWPGRIPFGACTVVAGHPGLAKSTMVLDVAAAVSTGASLPGAAPAAPRDVLIVCEEDSADRTIVPRLMTAGANRRRVYLLDLVRVESPEGWSKERGFDVTRDVDPLRAALAAHPQVGLVVIDPLSAYMGGTDTHRTSDVRGVLRPLERLAQDVGVAIVCVLHLNKAGGTEAMTRVSGSLAFVAAARAAFLVTAHPDDAEQRLLLSIKSNLGPKPSGLAYRVEGRTVEGKGDRLISTSGIVWTDEPVTLTADEALAAQASAGEDRTERDEATDWLLEALANGPRSRPELERRAKADGVSWRLVRRRAKVLGVEMGLSGFGGPGVWRLPVPVGPQSDQSDPNTVSGSNWSNRGPTGATGDPASSLDDPPEDVWAAIEGGESPDDWEADDVDCGRGDDRR
jgi:putative DNA primase/helicase